MSLLFRVLLSLLLPTLANTQVCNKVIWLILSFWFGFHFSVNGKMSMTVYILERQVPAFKMLRNSGSLSMMEALRLFSLYFSSTQHIQVRTYNVKFLVYLGRMKIGEAEDRILAWSMMVCFVSFFLKKKKKYLKLVSEALNWDVSHTPASFSGEDSVHIYQC